MMMGVSHHHHDGNEQPIHIPPQQPMPAPPQEQQEQPVVVATMSVSKTLARLFSIPSNRRCADCRVTLVDASQVFVSYSPPPPPQSQEEVYKSRYNQFMANHWHFALPGYNTHNQTQQQPPQPEVIPESSPRDSNNMLPTPPISSTLQDPCLLAQARTGGYGVFVCAMCGAAHKLLGPSICNVHAIQDVSSTTGGGSWTMENVQHVATAGGNQRAWDVYEAYVPHHWMVRLLPNAESSIADRLTFVRAKYQALAFLLPPSGQLAPRAWRRIMDLHPEWKSLWGTHMHSLADLELRGNAPMTQSFKHLNLLEDRDYSSSQAVLPTRLVDYFCVVTASDYLDPSFWHSTKNKDLSKLRNPDELRLLTEVTDCFPDQNAHDDTEFPEHVGAFLFPDGCSPKSLPSPPSFFTFVLTGANGSRLYGAVLRLYDKSSDVDGLKQVFENSGYKGKLPPWLSSSSTSPTAAASTAQQQQQQQQTSLLASDLLFYPKCLVVLSHYPFFDLWRKFLLQIYRICLVEAPLPIERFIANFVAEVPLPPPGKIQVQFGFTANEMWSIRRPAQNQLPLFNCSYQPLFTVLSVSNVLVVMACLLQETRVALVSKHYALLGPVAEALLSILFPFHWQGVYLPVMPYTMLEILEAPVPYLVGLHSCYLKDVPVRARPHGVVFVDLDHDVVHLGNHDEDNSNSQHHHYHQQQQPRCIPSLPERHALKLKAKLDTYAALVYVAPNSGKVGSMTQGSDERPVPYSEKCAYAQITAAEIPSTNSTVRRQDVLGNIDIAYRDSELLVPITGFLSEHGQFYEKESSSSSSVPLPSALNSSNHGGGAARGMRKLFRRHRRRSSGGRRRSDSGDEESAQSCNTVESLGSLLDLKDPPGFSAVEIRGAFLRFFVSVLSNYREYLSGDSFRATDFLSSFNISGSSLDFVHSMTQTQMFQLFLQERRDNPNDPEVLFFDASINAKRNRSKKTALIAGRNARKETSFLDDTSREYTDTYTPPAPSNWGLPYDGKAYHYGAFPELDPALFGKIRTPLEWSRELTMPSMRSARRASMAAIGHEQNFVSKALKPVIMSPLVSATKHGMKSLENALVSLSAPFANQLRRKSVTDSTNNNGGGGGARGSKQGSMRWGGTTAIASEVSATSDPTENEPEAVAAAEEVVLNARRKAVILLGIFAILQAYCRAHLDMKKSRHSLTGGSLGEMRGFHNNENGENVDHCYESAMATRIQSLVRGFLARRLLRSKKHAIVSIQARTHGRRIQFAYALLIHSISKVQTRCRGYLVRVRIAKFLEVRMRAYRTQIFKLWQRAYTPLSYRTKFWPLVAKQYGFVRQGIAETELIRLWKELGIPVQDGTGGNPMTFDVGNDIVVRLATVMGMSNWVYAQCVLVNSMLSGTPGSSTTPSTAVNASKRHATKESVIKGHNHSMLRLIAERKQVYERLAAIQSSGSDEKLLLTINFFGISHKNKKKKHTLAEALWQDVDLADESRLVIMQLFPELKQSSDICFVELPKKGVAMRFRSAEAAPGPLDSGLCGVHTLLEDRIRHDVAEVASICMLLVPELALRLSCCRGRTEIGSQRQRRAAMSARGLFSWEECRLEMMKSLIDNNCPSRQIKKAGSMRAVAVLRSESPKRSSPARLARRSSTQNLPIKKSSRRLSAAVTMPELLNGLFPRSSMSSTSQAVEEELAIAESVRRRSIKKETIHFI